jgi:hypothetical protein
MKSFSLFKAMVWKMLVLCFLRGDSTTLFEMFFEFGNKLWWTLKGIEERSLSLAFSATVV